MIVIENPLPSPYLPHACGLMHLPRVLEKIRRHWADELSDYYAKTLGRGFDDLLCQHLEIPYETLMEAVYRNPSGPELDRELLAVFPADLRVHVWNRKLMQRGLEGYAKERVEIRKRELQLTDRDDILTMCDLLEVVEGRLP
ncbi:MAG TPA: DUF5069 domain-containing protein [Opitutales bacterium]|nr:DUF5069 domain-containing protein [Opitutales bacterium]